MHYIKNAALTVLHCQKTSKWQNRHRSCLQPWQIRHPKAILMMTSCVLNQATTSTERKSSEENLHVATNKKWVPTVKTLVNWGNKKQAMLEKAVWFQSKYTQAISNYAHLGRETSRLGSENNPWQLILVPKCPQKQTSQKHTRTHCKPEGKSGEKNLLDYCRYLEKSKNLTGK